MTYRLKDMTRDELRGFVMGLGEKAFRADQLFAWLHKRGATSLDEMTDLAKELRVKLRLALFSCDAGGGGGGTGLPACRQAGASAGESDEAERPGKREDDAAPVRGGGRERAGHGDPLTVLEIAKVLCAADGTRKYLFRTDDGQYIEAALLKYRFGNTICVSSQAGCAMACSFCASGLGGLARDLTPGEMEDQLILAEKESGEEIRRIVVMGTGEPFANYVNLMKFLTNITDPKGRALGRRQITVSTCGLPEGLECFSDDLPQANLAISLHAANDELRKRIMPRAAALMGVDEIAAFARRYTKKTGRKITFEYALIKGLNDSAECVMALAELLRGINCLVNLIPLNPVPETGLRAVSREDALRFARALEQGGVGATVRREVGADIEAACGQLRQGRM